MIDLSTASVAGLVYRISIKSDGAENVEWFVNGASKGTSAGGPSAVGFGGESVIQIEVDNGGDAGQQFLHVTNAKIYVEQ